MVNRASADIYIFVQYKVIIWCLTELQMRNYSIPGNCSSSPSLNHFNHFNIWQCKCLSVYNTTLHLMQIYNIQVSCGNSSEAISWGKQLRKSKAFTPQAMGLDSMAVSLFGNMIVDTGEILINTKDTKKSFRYWNGDPVHMGLQPQNKSNTMPLFIYVRSLSFASLYPPLLTALRCVFTNFCPLKKRKNILIKHDF